MTVLCYNEVLVRRGRFAFSEGEQVGGRAPFVYSVHTRRKIGQVFMTQLEGERHGRIVYTCPGMGARVPLRLIPSFFNL